MFLLKKVCTSGREEIFSILRKSISLPKYTLLRSTLEIVTKKRHTIEFHSLRTVETFIGIVLQRGWLLRILSNTTSSRPEVFFEKSILRNFAKFTGKHPCQGLFFNKVTGLNLI